MLHRPILRHPIFRCPRNRFAHPASVLILALSSTLVCTAQVSVTTHHYDNYRTGWNSQETALTPATVHSSSFGVLKTIVLDDQVEAQPLVVPGVNITAGKFKGTTHDVVYVATDNNSIYAIDVTSGAVLLKPNFGPPVVKPLGCHIYNPDVGINSTPVIDLSSNTLYAVIYTQQSTAPAYFVHALDLGSLTDKVTNRSPTGASLCRSGQPYRQSDAPVGDRFAHPHRRNHRQFQRDLSSSAPCAAVGQWQCLCSLWQLLR